MKTQVVAPPVASAQSKIKIKPTDGRTLADKVDPNSPPKFERALKEARASKPEPDASVEKKDKAKADRKAETKDNDAAAEPADEVVDAEQAAADESDSLSDAPKTAKPKPAVKKVAAAVSEEPVGEDAAEEPAAKVEAKAAPVQPLVTDESPEAAAKPEKKAASKDYAEAASDASAQLAQAVAVAPPAAEKTAEVAAIVTGETTATPTVQPVDAKAKPAAKSDVEAVDKDAAPLLAEKTSALSSASVPSDAEDDSAAEGEVVDPLDATTPRVDHDSPPSPDLTALAPTHSFAHQLEKAVDVIRPAPAPPAAETAFVEQNHETIATNVRTTLLPGGGTMHLKLDPPELGAIQVSVTMRDGVMTASFQTSNDEATRLLSHSMSDLKATLEAQGVTVDRMQVQQSPRESSTNSDPQRGGREGQPQTPADAASQQQDQQRREMLKRMWRRVASGGDPLDLVA